MTARLSLLLLTDGRFPAGGYAHSGGLEAAVEAGLGVGDIPALLADRLAAIARPEAMLMLAAARAARAADLDALLVLDAEAEARTPSPPLRIAARRLGAQLLRTAATVWPGAGLIASYREASAVTPRPVAFGVVAAATGLGDEDAALSYLYEDAALVASAAVRLLPVDTAQALAWVAALEGAIAAVAAEVVATMLAPALIPSSFAPARELRSLAHARGEGRLFAT